MECRFRILQAPKWDQIQSLGRKRLYGSVCVWRIVTRGTVRTALLYWQRCRSWRNIIIWLTPKLYAFSALNVGRCMLCIRSSHDMWEHIETMESTGIVGFMEQGLPCKINIYVGCPESKFWWAIEKKKTKHLFPNHLYCHLMYIPYTTFGHSFHHCWGTCYTGAPVLYSCIVEWCFLGCKPRVNGFLDLVFMELLATRKVFRCRNTWKSLGTKSGP
jgi:hypothetical protein